MNQILISNDSSAVIDSTGTYRYSLIREWDKQNPFRVSFVMLNPSTADHQEDDMTIKKCMQFAKNFGGGSLEVVNLFAYRSTDPKELRRIKDPIGPDNNYYIRNAIQGSNLIIAAWGIHGKLHRRNRDVIEMLNGHSIYCLSITKGSHPSHPLFISYDTKIIPYKK